MYDVCVCVWVCITSKCRCTCVCIYIYIYIYLSVCVYFIYYDQWCRVAKALPVWSQEILVLAPGMVISMFHGKNHQKPSMFHGKICRKPQNMSWKNGKIGFRQVFLEKKWEDPMVSSRFSYPLMTDPGSGTAFFVSRSDRRSTGKWEPKMAGLGPKW